MRNRNARRELIAAIGELAEARGWLSTSAPEDRDFPTERITQALAHIDAALSDEGGE